MAENMQAGRVWRDSKQALKETGVDILGCRQ